MESLRFCRDALVIVFITIAIILKSQRHLLGFVFILFYLLYKCDNKINEMKVNVFGQRKLILDFNKLGLQNSDHVLLVLKAPYVPQAYRYFSPYELFKWDVYTFKGSNSCLN